MRIRRLSAALAVGTLTTLVSGLLVAPSLAVPVADPRGTVQRASVGPGGQQLSGALFDFGISPDGSAVFYVTASTELEANPGPIPRAYVRTLPSGEPELVSRNAAGEPVNDFVRSVTLSNGGEWVVFTTKASNMGLGAPAGVYSVYLLNRVTNELRLVSGDVPNNTMEVLVDAVITPDARYVVFAAGKPQQVYRYDVATAETVLVSYAAGGDPTVPAANNSYFPVISDDGRRVAFYYEGAESDLVAGGASATLQNFVRDLDTGALTRFSRDADGDPLPTGTAFYQLSPNGRYVTFASTSRLVTADDNNAADVYRYDLQTDETRLVSESAEGVVGDRTSRLGSVSDDGRTVAFISSATNLAPGDADGLADYMIKDMETGQVVSVMPTPPGERPTKDGSPVATVHTASNSNRPTVVDGDLFTFAFSSQATNLVPGDTNGEADLFVHQLERVESATPTLSVAPKVGVPVTAQTPGWDTDAALTYQWRIGGVAVPGATSPTYTPTAADAGRPLDVRVQGTRFAASRSVRLSASATVASDPVPPAVAASLASAAPRIKGTPRVGKRLKALPGAWTPGTTFTYQWRANGKVIKGATRSTLKLKIKQRKARITVVVTGSKAGFASVSRTSAATKRVR